MDNEFSIANKKLAAINTKIERLQKAKLHITTKVWASLKDNPRKVPYQYDVLRLSLQENFNYVFPERQVEEHVFTRSYKWAEELGIDPALYHHDYTGFTINRSWRKEYQKTKDGEEE